MPRLYSAARITTREGAVWRHCSGCGELSALAPGDRVCPPCVSASPVELPLHRLGARDRSRS